MQSLTRLAPARAAPRSGLAWKHFIDTGAGVIDADYRGNVGVVLFNFGDEPFEIAAGDRIAQLILEHVCLAFARLSDDFAFVGIFERWNETVQTLYGRLRALGHLIQREDLLLAPAPVELARTRSQSNKRELEAALAAEVTRVGGFEDPFDGPLYARAVHIFEGYGL